MPEPKEQCPTCGSCPRCGSTRRGVLWRKSGEGCTSYDHHIWHDIDDAPLVEAGELADGPENFFERVKFNVAMKNFMHLDKSVLDVSWQAWLKAKEDAQNEHDRTKSAD